eukprot:COSAG04_NODE_567_length_12551_cov_8.279553_11_plen_56_part_00
MALTTVAYPHQPANGVLLDGYVGHGQPAPDGGEAKLREEREGARPKMTGPCPDRP